MTGDSIPHWIEDGRGTPRRYGFPLTLTLSPRGGEGSPKWLCVVVKYAADDAFVVTVYLTDQLKAGETIWPKK